MKTKYQIVREYIEEQINNNIYIPNEKIESESKLMKRFGVSRHTVRLAIGDLVTEGLLYREQGSGTFCAEPQEYQDIKNNNTKRIAIITTYISDYIFPSIIRGAESLLSEAGYQVSIFSTNNSHEKERHILNIVLQQEFDGIIIEPTKSSYPNPNLSYYLELERLKIPFIMLNEYYDAVDPIYVILNDEKGGFMQAEHLIQHNHQNIVGIYKSDDMQGVKRMKGFLDAHRKYNITINPDNIMTYDTDGKVTATKAYLKDKLLESKKATAIACYNDELAVELLDVLRELNLRVPEDISIIGFDDSFLADVSETKLTSIIHPKTHMGECAANKIIEVIKNSKEINSNERKKVDSVIYEPEIKERHSVRLI